MKDVKIINIRPEIMTIVRDWPNNTKVQWVDSFVYQLSTGYQYQIWDEGDTTGIHRYCSTLVQSEQYGKNLGIFKEQSQEDSEFEFGLVEKHYQATRCL